MGGSNSKQNQEQLKQFKNVTKDAVGVVVDLLKSLDACHDTAVYMEKNMTTILDSTGEDEKNRIEECKKSALKLLVTTEETISSQKTKTITVFEKFLQYLTKLSIVYYESGDFGESLLETYKNDTSKVHQNKDINKIIDENDRLKKEVTFLKQNVKGAEDKLVQIESSEESERKKRKEIDDTFAEYRKKTTEQIENLEFQMKNKVPQLNELSVHGEVKELSVVCMKLEMQGTRMNMYLQQDENTSKGDVDPNDVHLPETGCEGKVFQNDLSSQPSMDIEEKDNNDENISEKRKYDRSTSNESNNLLYALDQKCEDLRICKNELINLGERLNQISYQNENVIASFENESKITLKNNTHTLQELLQRMSNLTDVTSEYKHVKKMMLEERDKAKKEVDDLQLQLKVQASEITDIKEQSIEYREQLDKLRISEKQCLTYQTDISAKDAVILTLHEDIKKQEDKLSKLSANYDEAVSFKEKHSECKNRYEQLKKEMENVQIEKGKLDSKVCHLETEKEEKRQEIEKSYNKLDTLTKIAEKYETDSEVLVRQRDSETQKREKLQTDLIALRDECNDHIKEKEVFLNEVTTLRSSITDTEMEHSRNIRIRDDMLSNLQDELQKRKSDIAVLNERLDEANKKNKDQSSDYENKFLQMDNELKDAHFEKGKLEAKINHLETEIEEKKQEIEKWHNRLDSLTQMERKYETDSATLTSEKNNEIQKREKLEMDITTLQDECNKHIKEKESFSNEVTTLRSSITDKEVEHTKTVQSRDDMISNLQDELQKRKSDIAVLNERLDEANKKNKDQSSDYENKFLQMDNELKDAHFEKGKLEAKINHLETEIEEKKQEIEKWHNKLDSLTQMERKYETDSARLTSEKNNEIQKREKLEMDITNLQDECDNHIKEKESFSNEVTTLRSSITDKEVEHTKNVQSRDDMISNLQDELQKRKSDIAVLNERLDEANKKNKDQSSDYENKFLQVDNELKGAHFEKGKLEAKINHLETEIEEKRQEIEKWHNKLESLTQMERKYETDSAALTNEKNNEIQKREKLQMDITKLQDECNNHIKEKEAFSVEITTLRLSMNELELKHKNTLRDRDERISSLDDCLNERKTEFEKLSLHLKDMNDKHFKLTEEIKFLHNERSRLEKEKCHEIEKLSEEKNKFDTETKRREDEKERLERQMEMLRVDLNGKLKTSLEEEEKLKRVLQDKNHEIERIEKLCEEIKENMTNDRNKLSKTLSDEIQNLKTIEKTLNRKLQITEDQLNQKESMNKQKDTEIRQLHSEKTSLTCKLDRLTEAYDTNKKELEILKSRKIIQVQLYCQSGVGLLSSVEDELKCMLRSKFDVEEGVDMDIISCVKATDINPEIPLLIMCIQASRLGTAVTSTVHGLDLTQKMAVLIFHHKDVHALPNQASERVLTGPELRNLGGIFDLAFLSGKGMYQCEMNRVNFISLINFIKREGKKHLKYDL